MYNSMRSHTACTVHAVGPARHYKINYSTGAKYGSRRCLKLFLGGRGCTCVTLSVKSPLLCSIKLREKIIDLGVWDVWISQCSRYYIDFWWKECCARARLSTDYLEQLYNIQDREKTFLDEVCMALAMALWTAMVTWMSSLNWHINCSSSRKWDSVGWSREYFELSAILLHVPNIPYRTFETNLTVCTAVVKFTNYRRNKRTLCNRLSIPH